VITGDAAIPLLSFMENRGRLDEVPNLVYKKGGIIKRSDKKYVATESDLGKLSYTNFELLKDYDNYHRAINQSGDLGPYAIKIPVKRLAWVPLGRGCPVNCSYCGGGVDAHHLLTGRSKPVYHPKDQVVETLKRFEEENIDSTYMDFDPCKDRSYYYDIFEMIRKEKIDISTEFALWSLSDKKFIKEFSRTFNPLYSTLVISPESGSEKVRRLNKGFYYDNKSLYNWMDHAKREAIPLEIYFASGLTGETIQNFDETIKLAEMILDDYPVVSLSCSPIQMEPASKRFLNPDKYGVRLKFRTFRDFYDLFRDLSLGRTLASRLGYDTEWESEEQIIENSMRFDKIFSETEPMKQKLMEEGKRVLKFKGTDKNRV
jgi:radical SAM superfamily enzyme YgiQ (UPF0313 family)